jgi:exodeoxyribonuclease-3
LKDAGNPMKIATWNVNSLKVRLEDVITWLQSAQPDILCLQEIKMLTENYPFEALEAVGYTSIASGQKTYNGVATLSKLPQTDPVFEFPDMNDEARRVLCTTIGDCRVLNIYVPNGQSVGSEKYDYKLSWLKHCRDFIAQECEKHPKLIVLGDFNIAPDDRDVYDPQAWKDSILCSLHERDALNALLDLGLQDTFRIFEQPAGAYSWWDFRTRAFATNKGLRIDLILATDAVSKTAQDSWIDIEPRTWERPSDHTPVVFEF